jgi:hypothetical protein
MQYCQCGKVWVDWGAGGRSSTVRVGWPGGNPDDWIETIDEMMGEENGRGPVPETIAPAAQIKSQPDETSG